MIVLSTKTILYKTILYKTNTVKINVPKMVIGLKELKTEFTGTPVSSV
jgi:hypothetical protein